MFFSHTDVALALALSPPARFLPPSLKKAMKNMFSCEDKKQTNKENIFITQNKTLYLFSSYSSLRAPPFAHPQPLQPPNCFLFQQRTHEMFV